MSISIIVDRKSSSKCFTIIPNHIINDKNLSLKAKGLISALLSLPPGYEYLSVERLAAKYKTGTTAIRSGLQELKDAGYLEIEQKYDAHGHYAGYEWRLSDHPKQSQIPENRTESPYTENPHSDYPLSENPRHINTNKTKKRNSEKTTTSPSSHPAPPLQELRLKAPMLAETREQVFKALNQVAPADQQRMLDELSDAIKAGTINTTAIRWFHGVIKRYQEGTYNFKPQPPQLVLQQFTQTLPSAPQQAIQSAPTSVTADGGHDLGNTSLSRLPRGTRALRSSSARKLSSDEWQLGQSE